MRGSAISRRGWGRGGGHRARPVQRGAHLTSFLQEAEQRTFQPRHATIDVFTEIYSVVHDLHSHYRPQRRRLFYQAPPNPLIPPERPKVVLHLFAYPRRVPRAALRLLPRVQLLVPIVGTRLHFLAARPSPPFARGVCGIDSQENKDQKCHNSRHHQKEHPAQPQAAETLQQVTFATLAPAPARPPTCAETPRSPSDLTGRHVQRVMPPARPPLHGLLVAPPPPPPLPPPQPPPSSSALRRPGPLEPEWGWPPVGRNGGRGNQPRRSVQSAGATSWMARACVAQGAY
jgi:hypothetical protein